jgi:cysteine desulfurase family protein
VSEIYLNNAATTFPKPSIVVEKVSRYIRELPADAGRQDSATQDPRTSCRAELAKLFGVDDPNQIVLLPSATHALNLVIQGLMVPGSHVVTTMLEHNSVLRPIAHRQKDLSIQVTHVWPDLSDQITTERLTEAVTNDTSLIVVTHASNVTGSVQPVNEIAELAAKIGVPLLIDASQSAGTIPLIHRNLPGKVYIAFAGHKGLLGLPGTGGLILAEGNLPQLIVGGSGVYSENPFHPSFLPLRHEAGTPNLPGVVGLIAGIQAVQERGVEVEGHNRHHLVISLRSQLKKISGVRVLPLAEDDGRAGIVSFTLKGWTPEEVGFALQKSFGITTRSGLHCAPFAHQVYGTAPEGTVRASFGRDNTEADRDAIADAVANIAR